MSVDADAADEEGYGTIRIRRLSSTSQVFGPGQIANAIQSDSQVTQALLPFTRDSNVETSCRATC